MYRLLLEDANLQINGIIICQLPSKSQSVKHSSHIVFVYELALSRNHDVEVTAVEIEINISKRQMGGFSNQKYKINHLL